MGRGVFDVLTFAGLWLFAGLVVVGLLFDVAIPSAVFVVLALGIGLAAKLAGDRWARFNDERDALRRGSER